MLTITWLRPCFINPNRDGFLQADAVGKRNGDIGMAFAPHGITLEDRST
jgi:hypothetical protein